MPDPDIDDLIGREVMRVQIQRQPNYPAWQAELKPYSLRILDSILDEDTTPDLILLAQEAPADEWEEVQFLSIIGGGNPEPRNMPALTNVTLGFILAEIRMFRKETG